MSAPSPCPPCPLCGGEGCSSLLRFEGFPALQNLFVERREEALGLPRRDIELYFCPACAFAFNPDRERRPESIWAAYDNNQLASPRYRAYLEELALELAESLSLGAGSRILEPACGDGWLLSRLRAHTGASVLGFDPQFRAERAPANIEGCVQKRFLREPTEPACDLVILRHVIELAEPLAPLLRAARGSLAPDGWLYLEVTDLDAAMRRGARAIFSREYLRYYSLRSLAIALAPWELSIVEARPCFGGDYLRVLARPQPGPEALRGSEALDRIEALLRERPKALIWGMGGRAVSALIQRGWDTEWIPFAVDLDPGKQGRFAPVTGQRILSPEEARAYGPELVIVANALYLEEIREQLGAKSAEGCLFVTLDGPQPDGGHLHG